MGTVDSFILRILSSEDKTFSLADIVKRIERLNLPKPPAKTAIYQRLSILNTKNKVDFEWEKGSKFYKISAQGKKEISEYHYHLETA